MALAQARLIEEGYGYGAKAMRGDGSREPEQSDAHGYGYGAQATKDQPRKPSGSPAGGQFASRTAEGFFLDDDDDFNDGMGAADQDCMDFERDGDGNCPDYESTREEHVGFDKLSGQLAKDKSIKDPDAVAAAIGREKYGAKGMAKKAAAGRACESCGVEIEGEGTYCATCEVAPPGWSGTVKAMKQHKDIDNPFALAWSMKNKGDRPHYAPEKGREGEGGNPNHDPESGRFTSGPGGGSRSDADKDDADDAFYGPARVAPPTVGDVLAHKAGEKSPARKAGNLYPPHENARGTYYSHDNLVHHLTQQDIRRDPTQKKHPYALGHELNAAQHVRAEVNSGTHPGVAFANAFNPTRGNHSIAKKMNLGLDVQHGQWVLPKATRESVTVFVRASFIEALGPSGAPALLRDGARAFPGGEIPLRSFQDDLRRKVSLRHVMHPDGKEADEIIGGVLPQTDPLVNYRYAEDQARSCATCDYFDKGACSLVSGMIRPVDTCDLWEGDPSPRMAQAVFLDQVQSTDDTGHDGL